MLNKSIEVALKNSSHSSELLDIMNYAVFPAGKLFRPKLVEALALDLNRQMTKNHYHLASAIEIHHAYTLVHDDLPSMDNDLIRRGKPSTHAQFGEWKAILAGDALLIASFHEVFNIPNRELHRLMSWTTGAKGLIDGQFMDLKADGKLDFSKVVRIHELKTGRLIQLATLGTYLLQEKKTFKGKVEFLRLGREIGVSFQLLDDLSELLVPEISNHEKKINPFINSPKEALLELRASHKRLVTILLKHKLDHAESMLQNYFLNNQANLLNDFSYLEKNIGGNLTELKNWITSFV